MRQRLSARVGVRHAYASAKARHPPVRLHQTLGYKSPDQFEAEYAPGPSGVNKPPTLSESRGLSQCYEFRLSLLCRWAIVDHACVSCRFGACLGRGIATS